LLYIVLFFAGLAGLYYGAEWLVKGGARFAHSFNIRPIVIGLTIVAFGTSAPELVTGVVASFNQLDDIIIGNVIGSNIANIGLVLGLTALITPISVDMKLLYREVPIIIGISGMFYFMSWNGILGRIEGGILLAGIIAYTYFVYHIARKESRAIKEEYEEFVNGTNIILMDIVLIAIGLAALIGGAHVLLRSAIYIATVFGISELVVGLSVIAVGTSLPELAISMVASFRKESDISVGNVLGSNIYNIFVILGVIAVIQPLHINASTLRFDIPIMILFSVILMPMIIRKFKLGRTAGMFLFGGYCAYIVFLYRNILHQ